MILKWEWEVLRRVGLRMRARRSAGSRRMETWLG
jgi:hypothetical protein